MTKEEIKNAIFKGLGIRPTFFLLKWTPIWKNPFKFSLLEIMKCSADGGIVTKKSAQSPRGEHSGHRIISPNYFGWWTFFKVQLRIIQ